MDRIIRITERILETLAAALALCIITGVWS